MSSSNVDTKTGRTTNPTPAFTKGPNLVPESLLKKKNDLDRLALERKAQLKNMGNRKVFSKASVTGSRGLKVRKLEKFVVQSKSQKHAKARHDRVLKKGLQSKEPKKNSKQIALLTSEGQLLAKGTSEEVEETKRLAIQAGGGEETAVPMITEVLATNSLTATFILAIRLRPDHNLPKAVKRTLSTLRLRTQYSATFLQYNETTQKNLALLNPYIVYGKITTKTVKDLLTRKGYAKIDGNRTPLSDNTIIEKELGDIGVICLEDIVAEIVAGSENFGKVRNIEYRASRICVLFHFAPACCNEEFPTP